MRKAIFLITALLASSHVWAQKKPNILWITIEDTSPEFIGCYGNKNARTPAIDQLAKDGIRFTNAFSTGTVCSPSRTCLITGVKTYANGTGHHRSAYHIPDSMHGFPYYLKQAGYRTTNNAKTDYNVANGKAFTTDAWDESSAKTGWWNRKAGQPFFAVFNYNDSHQSRTMTDPYDKYKKDVLDELPAERQIGEKDFEVPPFYRDSPEMRKQLARVYNAISLTDLKIGKLLKRLEDDHLRDSTIIFFFADHGEGIPRGKTNGIDLGYHVPFVIWFPPMYAHLSPWGKAGVVSDELIDFEDLAPTLIALAGGTNPDHIRGRKLIGAKRSELATHLVLSSDRSDNGIDMVRSVTDGRYMYSRNFMPYMPQARYIRYMEIGDIKQVMRKDLAAGNMNALQRSLFDARPAEYLYDTQADPWETKNLASDSRYQAMLSRFRKTLELEMLASRDVLLLPEYELAQLPDSTNAYEFRMDDKRFNVKSIYHAASLSGFRTPQTWAEQLTLLHDINPAVRYWAAIGLRSQRREHLLKHKTQLLKAMQDPYPPAAVLAASIAFGLFDSDEAAIVLRRHVLSENPEIALMAVNELLYLDNKQPFLEAVQAAHKLERTKDEANSRTYKVRAACMDFLAQLGKVENTPAFAE